MSLILGTRKWLLLSHLFNSFHWMYRFPPLVFALSSIFHHMFKSQQDFSPRFSIFRSLCARKLQPRWGGGSFLHLNWKMCPVSQMHPSELLLHSHFNILHPLKYPCCRILGMLWLWIQRYPSSRSQWCFVPPLWLAASCCFCTRPSLFAIILYCSPTMLLSAKIANLLRPFPAQSRSLQQIATSEYPCRHWIKLLSAVVYLHQHLGPRPLFWSWAISHSNSQADLWLHLVMYRKATVWLHSSSTRTDFGCKNLVLWELLQRSRIVVRTCSLETQQ